MITNSSRSGRARQTARSVTDRPVVMTAPDAWRSPATPVPSAARSLRWRVRMAHDSLMSGDRNEDANSWMRRHCNARLMMIGLDGPARQAHAQQVVEVLAQPRPEWEVMERLFDEFERETGIRVNITYFAELERRSRSRLDASSGAGQFDVYYIDEANIAEFAANGWLVPIRDYYPEEYDFDGFSPALVEVLSHDGNGVRRPHHQGGRRHVLPAGPARGAGSRRTHDARGVPRGRPRRCTTRRGCTGPARAAARLGHERVALQPVPARLRWSLPR
jgi:hypothetical protein